MKYYTDAADRRLAAAVGCGLDEVTVRRAAEARASAARYRPYEEPVVTAVDVEAAAYAVAARGVDASGRLAAVTGAFSGAQTKQTE